MADITPEMIATVVRLIDQQKGKHVKQVLTALEREGKMDAATRKIILDGFNNMTRAVYRVMGYNVEQ